MFKSHLKHRSHRTEKKPLNTYAAGHWHGSRPMGEAASLCTSAGTITVACSKGIYEALQVVKMRPSGDEMAFAQVPW